MSVEIVDYQRKYAAGLAKMWNASTDDWGGFTSVETEESVINEVENSEHLNTWVALVGDEVVGYGCLSEYREDEGASYIPLLNVRPDYHGKKVGKALLLRALEQACQYCWPRLDLYTWPGNVKAVPLYKKCGFFWEDRPDSTHLMNFMPYVHRTEAVADFFRQADWYADSVREISVEPDGRRDNGFEYFNYHWRHGQSMLRMEFERRGRGLRLIETEDWLVAATVEDLNLAFGRDYTIKYDVVNKSGKPLEVSIRGRDDKNISFDLECVSQVEDEKTIESKFYVGEIQEEQSVRRTHPGVVADLLINGKKARFKVGVVPKLPATITSVLPEREFAPGMQGKFYLNIESAYNEPASFTFTLPEADFIELDQRHFQVDVVAGQKKTLPIGYRLKGLGLVSDTLMVKAVTQQGSTDFQHRLTLAFAGGDTYIGGETEDDWFVVNGRFMLSLNKFSNNLVARPLARHPFATSFLRPQLGRPISVEFGKTKPIHVEYSQQAGRAYLQALYRSQDFPGIELHRQASLQADGLVHHQWSITNRGDSTVQNLFFRTVINQPLAGAFLPLQGKVMEIRDGYGEEADNISWKDVHENWLYSPAGMGWGLCWPREYRPTSNGLLSFDLELGTLAPGETREIKPLVVAMGTFGSWQQLRRFALQQGDEPEVIDSLELKVNNGNPFVQGDFPLELEQHKKLPFSGTVTATSQHGNLSRQAFTQQQAALSLTAPQPGNSDLIQVDVDTPDFFLQRQTAVFATGGEVQLLWQQRQGIEALVVENGSVSFSVAPEFGPALVSLDYMEQQWLASSFPKAGPHSFWNPWLGGVGLEVGGMPIRSLLKEPRTVEFTRRQDNRGNWWQGIKCEIQVCQHEKYKGLHIRLYFLTLPGMAGICTFAEFDALDRAWADVTYYHESSLAPGGAVAGSWVEHSPRPGSIVRIKAGAGRESRPVHKLVVGSDQCQHLLLACTPSPLMVYTNKDVLNCGIMEEFTLRPGTKTFPPLFLLFTAHDVEEKALEALLKIKF